MCTPCENSGWHCSTQELLKPHKFTNQEMFARIMMLQKMIDDPSIFRDYYESANNIPCPFCALLFWHVDDVQLIDEIEAVNERQLKDCPVCDEDYDREDYSEPCGDVCGSEDPEDCCGEEE